MSKINLTELPTIQSVDHKPVSFRGSTSSNQYNTFSEDAYFDITNLYSVINDMTNSFQEMSMAHSIDSTYTQMRIGDMPAIIEQLQSEIDGYKYGTHRKAIIYPSRVANGTENKADINIQYGQVNIPAYAVSSKLYIYDETLDLITIPSTLISKVSPESDGVTIVDNDFKNCIKNFENEYFIRKVYSNATDPVDIQIEITLPDNIISSRNVNTIYLSPYPFAALDILNIEYQAETDWNTIPGFSSHKQYKDGAIKNAENIKLCFNKMQISKIRVTLRQSTYIVEGEHNVFYLGLKHLGVNHEAVDRKFCTFIADINFNSTKKKTIFNIVPKLNNNNILSDTTENKKTLFSFELYSVNDVGEKRYIKDTIPFTLTDERLMVITNMYYDATNDINPSLYKLEIEYDIDGDGSGGTNQTPVDTITSDSDCKCILSNMIFNGDNIIIGADENSKPYQLNAVTILDGDCAIKSHVEKNIVYTYTIKDYGAGARISGDTLVVNSAGTVVITATARLGKAIISKDTIFTVSKIKKYTLTYLSTTGGTIEGKKIQNIELGNDAEPVKAIENVGYHFLQWSDAVVTNNRHDRNITSSSIHTAQFEINQYPVIYLDKEGREFYREMVKHGFPATPPTAPVLDDYLFTGWDKPLDSITEPVTVQAQYRIKTFIVKFLDWDDRLISTQEIVIHEDAVVPETPIKEGYDFIGWNQTTTGVTTDITAKAQFTIKTFVVTFLNWNGEELSKQTINWMKDAKAPVALREGWHFVSWSDVYIKVVKDITITAQFEINMYQVKFLDWDGRVIKSENIPYGSDATAPEQPSKVGYDFTGWDKAFSNIKNNVTVTATFKIKVFAVKTIAIGDGIVTASSTKVEYGDSVTISTNYSVSHQITAFSVNGSSVNNTSGNPYVVPQVTSDIEVIVTFEIKKYTVYWRNYDNTIISRETVDYGTMISSLKAPAYKEKGDGYYFDSWSYSINKVTPITKDVEITAIFKSKIRVVWYENALNGSYTNLLKTQYVMPGSKISDLTVPDMNYTITNAYGYGMFFKAWYPTIPATNTITSDTTFYGQWGFGAEVTGDEVYKSTTPSGRSKLLVYTYPIILNDNLPKELPSTGAGAMSNHMFNTYNGYNNSLGIEGGTKIKPRTIKMLYDSMSVNINDVSWDVQDKSIAKVVKRGDAIHVEGLRPGTTTITFTNTSKSTLNSTIIDIVVEKIQPILKPVMVEVKPYTDGHIVYTGFSYSLALYWAEKKYYSDTLASPVKHTKRDENYSWKNAYWSTYDSQVRIQELGGIKVNGIKCAGTSMLAGNCGSIVLGLPDTGNQWVRPGSDYGLSYFACSSGTETIELTLDENTFNMSGSYNTFNPAYAGTKITCNINCMDGGVKTNIGSSALTSEKAVTFQARCGLSAPFTKLAWNGDTGVPLTVCYPTRANSACPYSDDYSVKALDRCLGYSHKNSIDIIAIKQNGDVEVITDNSKLLSIEETYVAPQGFMFATEAAKITAKVKPSEYQCYIVRGTLSHNKKVMCSIDNCNLVSSRNYMFCVK